MPKTQNWTFAQHQGAERYAVDFSTERAEYGKEWNDPEFLTGAKSFKPNGHREPFIRPFVRKIKSVDEFTSEYSPINYTIDGALPVSSIYGVTGKRGSAKTALLTAVSLAVLTGQKKPGRCNLVATTPIKQDSPGPNSMTMPMR